MKKLNLKIKGMHCASCAMLIKGMLEDIGVKSSIDFASGRATAEFDDKKTSAEEIVHTIEKRGYGASRLW